MADASITSEDWAFIRAMLDVPEDRNTWLVYADWLDDRGDPRAEFLRLMVQLRDLGTQHPERGPIEARVAELRNTLDPGWLLAFDPAQIGNCAGGRCERNWCELRATDLPDVRLCPACDRAVHYCLTIEEARAFASCGARVALSTRVPLALLANEPAFGDPPVPPPPPDYDWDDYVDTDAIPPDPPVAFTPPPATRPWWKFW